VSTSLRVETPEGLREIGLGPEDAALTLADLLARRGLPLNMRCGGRGLCSGCEVGLVEGELVALAGDTRIPAPAEEIRACQVRAIPGRSAGLRIPPRSLLRHEPAVVAEFRLNVPWAQDPLDATARYGAAVDVGTTTVALLLADLRSGAALAGASAFNAQVRFGEDVLTRIQRCHDDPAALAGLQRAIAVETLQPLLEQACAEAGVALSEVGVMTVAANTTMQHLLAGVDPSPLGVHPFLAVFLEHRVLPPAELGLRFGGDGARIHLLPGPAAYVGADLAAGIVATGLLYREGLSLLVDVGTNGEIVAQCDGRLLGCATAAGPAFEGAGLSSGTRGVRGAIERIRLRTDPFAADLGIIGDVDRPLGVCGSGYVDFLWEAKRAGILGANGRYVAAFAEREPGLFDTGRYGRKLRLHPKGASGPVWVTELDVARLLQAKAAIAAGIITLLGRLGRTPADVDRLYLAGGFGMHLSLEHAIGCGLLPGFEPGQIEVVGNTSLGGAFLALNDRAALAEMKAACARLESVELNLDPGFESCYIDHLTLPD
jgi:uncharacterized 2Fe-2S/4Fe-4S cluster protein (DUF4445 family)